MAAISGTISWVYLEFPDFGFLTPWLKLFYFVCLLLCPLVQRLLCTCKFTVYFPSPKILICFPSFFIILVFTVMIALAALGIPRNFFWISISSVLKHTLEGRTFGNICCNYCMYPLQTLWSQRYGLALGKLELARVKKTWSYPRSFVTTFKSVAL